LEAGAITAIRTAACSGVATKYLYNDNQQEVICAILGTGAQAETHLEAMICVLGEKIKEMRIWGRNKEKADKFVHEQEKKYFGNEGSPYKNLKFKFKVVATAKEAVSDADVINTCTSSKEPVVNGEWVKEGAHINAVGACTPFAREIDSTCVAKSKIFVDSLESCWNEAGDILIPMNQEKRGDEIKKNVMGEMGQLLSKKIKGREKKEEITLFKSLGIAVEDIVVAFKLMEIAKQKKKGTTINI